MRVPRGVDRKQTDLQSIIFNYLFFGWEGGTLILALV